MLARQRDPMRLNVAFGASSTPGPVPENDYFPEQPAVPEVAAAQRSGDER